MQKADTVSGFPIGELTNSPNFIGDFYLNRLTTPNDVHCNISNVTFSPSCRNHWHIHTDGQILIVTGGRGWYQEFGKQARELHPGEIVQIPKNIKHWHGAAKDTWFSHLSVTADNGSQRDSTEWLEAVSDETYYLLT